MNAAPVLCEPLDAAIHDVLDDLRAHQVEMTRLFSVGVDILNAARTLDSMSAELQMLARNGVVQAAQMNRSGRGGHGEGASLLALAEILSGCPRRIAAELARLGERCRAIASHTAHCSGLARRHTQHLNSLLLVLGRECGAGQAEELAGMLRAAGLRRPGDLGRVLARADGWQLPPALAANLRMIGERGADTARKLAALLQQTGACLRETEGILRAIERIAETVNYLGVNVAIEAAHCADRGENFRQLAQEIQATVARFEQKLRAIRHTAERGRVLLAALES